MSSIEFTYWQAFNRIDPFGEDRADLRTGIVAATVANCHRSRDSDPFAAKDFMWQYSPPAEKQGNAVVTQSPAEVARLVDRHFEALMFRSKIVASRVLGAPTIPATAVEPYALAVQS